MAMQREGVAGNGTMGFKYKDTVKTEVYNLLFMLLIIRTKNNRAYILEKGEKIFSLDRGTHWDRQF